MRIITPKARVVSKKWEMRHKKREEKPDRNITAQSKLNPG